VRKQGGERRARVEANRSGRGEAGERDAGRTASLLHPGDDTGRAAGASTVQRGQSSAAKAKMMPMYIPTDGIREEK
jgi:hypothetical protein